MINPKIPYVVVGTPAYGGQLTAVYACSVLALQEACRRRADVRLNVLVHWGDALIPRARQDLVTRFMEMPEATHLLFVDSDIGFSPDQVFRLLASGHEMTAGVYPCKNLHWPRLQEAARKNPEMNPAELLGYTARFEDPSRIVMDQGFAKAVSAGMGFTLLQKSVLERMMKHYPELQYRGGHIAADPLANSSYRYALFNSMVDEKTGYYLADDQSFCRRWTALGGEIWVDARSRLNHVGPMIFRGDFATQFDPGQPD